MYNKWNERNKEHVYFVRCELVFLKKNSQQWNKTKLKKNISFSFTQFLFY